MTFQPKPWEMLVQTCSHYIIKKLPLHCRLSQKVPCHQKMTEDLSADCLILTCKIIFAEFGLTKKIMSDSGGNFISDKFKKFCRSLEHRASILVIIPSPEQQTDGSMHQTCKVKCSKYVLILNLTHIYALLQIRSTPLGPGLPSPTTTTIHCQIRGIRPIINSPPIVMNDDDEHYEALIKRKMKNYKNHDTPKYMLLFL